jgi:hypothetical protein
MSLLIRKIKKSKWLQDDDVPNDVPADAITGCMRTQHNTLSVWEVPDESKIDEAVLAIVSAADRLETIDVVQIDREHLEQNEIDCKQIPGRTEVKDLADTHIDLSNLAYKELGIIACHIADKFRQDKVKRYRERRIKEILRTAIQKQRLEIENLSESIRKKL